MLASILAGFVSAMNFTTIGMLVAGIAIGGVFGALPGLTATMAMALLVPLTFFMPPLAGIPFLLGVYKGGVWGGSVPAVLISVPGTGAAVATLYDGYPLAKQGFAKKALIVALLASALGELFADIFVLFIMEPLSRVALAFGAADFFSLILASLIVMATVSAGAPIKGLASLSLGLFLATIGMDPAFGINRFTFGSLYLSNGFNFVPVVIGLFAVSTVFEAVYNRYKEALSHSIASDKGPGLTFKETIKVMPAIFKGTVVGTITGMIPALAQPIAAFMGYALEQKTNKKPTAKFGEGALEGVAAPEAANNAVNGGALVPLLTFGIPGDIVTAILLGALVVQGLRPGPRLMIDNAEIMYTILATLVIGNILLLFVGRLLIEPFSRIVLIPKNYLLPILIVLCFVGTFALNNSMFDVYTALVCGILGFVMKKRGFSVSTLAISFLLGKMLEKYLVQALAISKGNPSVFFTRPISLGLLIIVAVTLVFAVRNQFKTKNKNGKFAA